MIDIDNIMTELQTICFHYEKSSPAVSQWADDLYIRLQENPKVILLGELLIINHLQTSEGLMPANYAQNILYHLLDSLELSTVGMIDF